MASSNNTEFTYNEHKHDISKCIQHFRSIVLESSPINIKSAIIDFAMKAEIQENLIRPIAWKIMLNILPCNKESTIKTWIDTIRTQRLNYKAKIKELKTLKKFDFDPLGGSHTEEWQSIFEGSESKRLILLDVSRTYQEKDLFCQQQTKDILTNVLFIWAKEHKMPSYRQGMNEILAVIFYAMFPFYTHNQSSQNDIESYITQSNLSEHCDELYSYFHDESEFECDLYYLFSNIMDKCLSKLFEYSEKGNKCYLIERCDVILKEKLKKVDYSLFLHFGRIDIDCGMVLQRWLKCLFGREFHIENVVVLWDLILADEIVYKTKDLQMIDYVSLAMLLFIREELIKKNQNDCFQRLFRYPPVESIVSIVNLAKKIKGMFTKKQDFFPIKDNSKQEKKKEITNNNNVVSKVVDSKNSQKKGKNSMMDFLKSHESSKQGNDTKMKKESERVVDNFVSFKEQDAPLPKSLLINNSNNYSKKDDNGLSDNKNDINVKSKEIEDDKIQDKEEERDNNVNDGNEQVGLNEDKNVEQTIEELKNIFIKYKGNMEIDDINQIDFLFDKLKKQIQ